MSNAEISQVRGERHTQNSRISLSTCNTVNRWIQSDEKLIEDIALQCSYRMNVVAETADTTNFLVNIPSNSRGETRVDSIVPIAPDWRRLNQGLEAYLTFRAQVSRVVRKAKGHAPQESGATRGSMRKLGFLISRALFYPGTCCYARYRFEPYSSFRQFWASISYCIPPFRHPPPPSRLVTRLTDLSPAPLIKLTPSLN